MAILPKGAVIIGPNTLSGTPQALTRQGKDGSWGEFCTPWQDAEGKEFDSNATRVAIWFRTWNDAQQFVRSIIDAKYETDQHGTAPHAYLASPQLRP